MSFSSLLFRTKASTGIVKEGKIRTRHTSSVLARYSPSPPSFCSPSSFSSPPSFSSIPPRSPSFPSPSTSLSSPSRVVVRRRESAAKRRNSALFFFTCFNTNTTQSTKYHSTPLFSFHRSSHHQQHEQLSGVEDNYDTDTDTGNDESLPLDPIIKVFCEAASPNYFMPVCSLSLLPPSCCV
jgi:hypothetical protein